MTPMLSWRYLVSKPFFMAFPKRYPHSSWVWVAPLGLVAFYDRPVLEGAGVFILIFAVVHLADRAWDLVSTAMTVRTLTRTNQSFEKPIFRDFTDYLGEDLGGALDAGGTIHATDLDGLIKDKDFSAKGEQLPLGNCYLFQLLPREDGAYVGSFALNVAPSVTFVFTPYGPENLNASRLLALLHEFGHCSEESWERRRSLWGAVVAASGIFLLSLNSLVAVAACSFYVAIGLYRNYFRGKSARFWEELSADAMTASLFTRVISTPDLFHFTKKIMNPKRKIVTPVDSQLDPLENYARVQGFVAAMRDSSENIEKADLSLNEVVKKHVRHSLGITVVALSGAYLLFSFFEIGFANSFNLTVYLGVALAILFFVVFASMAVLVRSTVDFFAFHTSHGAKKEAVKTQIRNREFNLDVTGFMGSGEPLATALFGIQQFGVGTMQHELQAENAKLSAVVEKTPQCVRDLGLSVVEFMMSSSAFHGLREMALGRKTPPLDESDENDRKAFIEKWMALSELIGRHVAKDIMSATDKMIEAIQPGQGQHASGAVNGEALRVFLAYNGVISASVGIAQINFKLFKLSIVRGMRYEMDDEFGDLGNIDGNLPMSYEEFVDGFAKFSKRAGNELEEHTKPIMYAMWLLSDDEGTADAFRKSFEAVLEIQNKLLWTFSDVIDGMNMIGDLMQDMKPDPERIYAAFLREFAGEIK